MKQLRIILISMMLLFGACTSQKKLIYFQGAIPSFNTDSIFKIKLGAGDILLINIFTINAEAYPYLSVPVQAEGNDSRSAYEKGYILNDKGEVRLPLVGSISLQGLTIQEAAGKIEERFREFIQDPIVTVKKLNFKVTVLGEVNKPGTYPILNERVTLPELLGMAGDLTQFGDRKNLRIIRDENGKRSDFFVDLTNAQSLSAANYYLHPDDIVYVSPVPRRAFQNINPSITLFASILTSTVVILTFIITTSK